MSYSTKIVPLSKSGDQKSDILAAIVPYLEQISPIYGNDVLTATYIEPEQTVGGIYLPEARLKESVYQGKVGLVLALGIDAFKYREGYDFFCRRADETDLQYSSRLLELTPKQGDWVFYRPVGNLWKCTIAGFACQFVKDSEIKGRVTNPNAIF